MSRDWKASRRTRPERSSELISVLVATTVVGAVFLSVFASVSRRPAVTASLLVGLLLAFATLAIQVHTRGRLSELDVAVTAWFFQTTHRSHVLDVTALAVSRATGAVVIAVAGVAFGIFKSWRARSVMPGLAIVGTLGTAGLAETAFKAIVERRLTAMDLELLGVSRHPFPSGHVLGAGALLGLIAVSIGGGRAPAVLARWAGVTVLLLVVALAQMYLGAHWLSDVLGGAILAGLFVTMGWVLMDSYNTRSDTNQCRKQKPAAPWTEAPGASPT